MILARNLLQARATSTIETDFLISSFTVTKIQVKVRKRPDHTTAFRRAIVPVDDIILRCNHFTNHVE